ncbi:kinase-like domain-containing protein [Hyaloraphidium curvatum]|nr:kinase-like domain-containing protein [Hyaloraphidium curvatum]
MQSPTLLAPPSATRSLPQAAPAADVGRAVSAPLARNRSWNGAAAPALARSSSSPAAPAAPYPIEPAAAELPALYAHGKARRKVYKDVRVLGRGSEGTVKLATCVETGEQVALKSMPKPPLPSAMSGKPRRPGTRDDALEARLKFERDIRKRFFVMRSHSGHPHLPTYIELFETESKFYIVSAICQGGTLEHYVNEQGGVLEEADALFVTTLLLRTLAYIHSHGITHRDIKPSNIFLRHKGKLDSLTLADFAGAFVDGQSQRAPQQAAEDDDEEEDYDGSTLSLSSARSSMSGSGGASTVLSLGSQSGAGAGAAPHFSQAGNMKTLTGTPYYLAPEIVDGRGYTSAVDVWSAGCIAYEMLYGRSPFQHSSSFTELYGNISRGAYEIPADAGVSDAAGNFVRELLETDPACRLTAVQALQHPWILGNSTLGRKARLLSGAQVFWRADGGVLEPVLPTDSGVGLEQLSLGD